MSFGVNIYERPDAAKAFVGIGQMRLSGGYETMEATVPAYGAGLPDLPVASPAAQEYLSGDAYQTQVICSGTWAVIGTDTVGCLLQDTKVSTTGVYVTAAANIMVPLKASLTPAAGNDIYFDSTDGLFTTVSTSNIWVGKAKGAKQTDPSTLLPAGDWLEIHFKQSEI